MTRQFDLKSESSTTSVFTKKKRKQNKEKCNNM